MTDPIRINVRSLPDYEGTKSLDGQVYRLRFVWNASIAGWFLTLTGISNGIVINLALVCGRELLAPFGYRNTLGQLRLIDTSGRNQDPTFAGMGTRWVLEYTPRG